MNEPSSKPVLICGLGQLGQHCAAQLKELGIPVYGLHDVPPASWEIEDLPAKLDRLTVGDCRRTSALLRAGIAECRAVLLTTSDERINVSAALAARSLNPDVRVVIRSSQASLSALLHERLNNLIALDIADLPATAFSLAATGDDTVGLFSVNGQMLRVVETRVTAEHPWHSGFRLCDLNTRGRRVLHHDSVSNPSLIDFHGWNPEERVATGDVIVSIEFNVAKETVAHEQWTMPSLRWSALRERAVRLWSGITQTQRLAALVAVGMVLIHATGVILYRLRYPEVSLLDAFNVATVLIFDGYSNMFAQLKLPFPIPLWLLLFSLAMTMSGAVVTGILYAYITARVLSARLQFRRRPGRIPRSGHTVVIGLGSLGRHVAELLRSLKVNVVGVGDAELDSDVLPGIPVITGDLRQSLQRANCATAESVLVLTDDDVSNLEIALMTARLNGQCSLVIRTEDADFASYVKSLAPHMKAMSVYALSAEAFAAAALGERILSLLRISGQTVLATEYTIEAGDTLEGKLIVDVTCGYGLVAILYQSAPTEKPAFFPSDDLRLEIGGRLVVLATMEGLQSVEHGTIKARDTRVRISRAGSKDAAFEGGRTLVRITGCKLSAAREMMSVLPGTLPLVLFRHQADRLVRELGLVGLEAEVVTESSHLNASRRDD